VRLEEPNGEEERTAVSAFEQVESHGDDVVGVVGRDLEDLVVPDDIRFLADMLFADECRPVTVRLKRVDDMLAVIVE
jgi:hypothetical protein